MISLRCIDVSLLFCRIGLLQRLRLANLARVDVLQSYFFFFFLFLLIIFFGSIWYKLLRFCVISFNFFRILTPIRFYYFYIFAAFLGAWITVSIDIWIFLAFFFLDSFNYTLFRIALFIDFFFQRLYVFLISVVLNF